MRREMTRYPTLSPRLAAVADVVPAGDAVLDLGTDHARLAEALVCGGTVPFVVAADRSSAALSSGIARIADSAFVEKIDFRCGDGLDVVCRGETPTVVMAGFGATAMIRVLKRGPLAGIRRVVLQPQLDLEYLRGWLVANHFGLVDERLAEDNGRYYWVLVAEPLDHSTSTSHAITKLDQADQMFGPWLRRRGGPLFSNYLHADHRRVVAAMAAARSAGVEMSRLADLSARLGVIDELLAAGFVDRDDAMGSPKPRAGGR